MKKLALIAAMALVSVAGFAQPKFAHVNFTEVVQLMPDMDAAREQMNSAQQEASETYQSMVEEFNTKYSQYQQKASTWTAAIRESKEKELTDIQGRIEEFNQSIQAELSNLQNELMSPIYAKAQEAVRTIAKAGGYIYVVDLSTPLYVDDTQSVDITREVRRSLGISDDKTLEALQAQLQAQAQAQQAQ